MRRRRSLLRRWPVETHDCIEETEMIFCPMVKRLLVIVIATATVTFGVAAQPQAAGKVYRIGILSNVPKSNAGIRPRYKAFIQGLRDLGYVEGRNVVFLYRFPRSMSGRETQLARLATELVKLKPDVIFTFSSPATDMAVRATHTIPIVVGVAVNRHVANYRHPGGNVTGLSSSAGDLVPKQLQLFQEAVPGLKKVAVMWNPDHHSHADNVKKAQTAAPALGLEIVPVGVTTKSALPRAFNRMIAEKVQGLLVLRGGVLVNIRPHISDHANKLGIPTMFGHPVEARAGGLMSYGVSVRRMFRQAATYVDKILKGARPADLPVERPTKLDLVLNLKTAKRLHITFPRSILLRADEVIE